MKTFLAGLIIGLVILPLALIFYVKSGRAPVAASDSPMPFETHFAHAGLHARIAREAPQRDASGFTTSDLVNGAEVYQKNCAFCHGLPQQSPSAAGRGMFPHAPQLFTVAETVTDDPAGVTFWKVKNGIRLTGMPGFKGALMDEQMWQVSALLARADKLPPEALDALKPAPVTPAPAAAGQSQHP